MTKVLMGIGNELNGDDAIGVLVARKLKKELIGWEVIDAGVMPESYTSKIERLKPELLVMVDAIDGEELVPGDVKIVDRKSMGNLILSTHSIPLSVLYDYLSQSVQRIVVIGIKIGEHAPYTPCMLNVDKVSKKVYNIIKDI